MTKFDEALAKAKAVPRLGAGRYPLLTPAQWQAIADAYAAGASLRAIYEALVAADEMPHSSLAAFRQAWNVQRLRLRFNGAKEDAQ